MGETQLILTIRQVASRTSLSPATIARLVKRNLFPQPLHISKRRVGWRSRDIVLWAEQGGAQ